MAEWRVPLAVAKQAEANSRPYVIAPKAEYERLTEERGGS